MMKKLTISIVLLGFVAALGFAQQPIRVGEGMYLGYLHEALNEFDGYRGQEYIVDAQEGLTYQIGVMSDEFDTYVVVYLPDGTRESNDDGGDGLNSLIRVTPATSGEMRIIARGFSPDPVGNYGVEITAFNDDPVGVQEIDLGIWTGRLGAGSGEHEGYRADEYVLDVEDGDPLRIDLTSDDFDTYVVIYHPDGTREYNDDGGDGLNSRLFVSARGSGEMRIFARGWQSDPSGAYTLEVQSSESVSVDAISIEPGTIEGVIGPDDAQYEGYRGVEYELEVEGGETYRLDMTSDDFDTYLVVYHPDGTREFDDDGGEGFNAGMFTTPRTSGSMRIIARGWQSSPVGTFTLEAHQLVEQ